jgi:hypothetical protein
MTKTIHTYELNIGESVGPIQLGAPRSLVIQELGEPEETRRGVFAIRDNYYGIGISIEYRIADEVCANITVWSPAELLYQGKDLLMMTWVEGTRWLARLDPEAEEEGEGWESNKVGLGIYPKRNDDGSFRKVDFINVFDQQYCPTNEEIEEEIQRMNRKRPSNEECARELGLII